MASFYVRVFLMFRDKKRIIILIQFNSNKCYCFVFMSHHMKSSQIKTRTSYVTQVETSAQTTCTTKILQSTFVKNKIELSF